MSYEKRIILALRKVMQSMDLHSKGLIKDYDITIPQVMCLYELAEKGTMTGVVLAKNVHLSPSTIVGIIDRLEEKKLVTRTRDSEDRRAVFIDITEKGQDFVATTPHLLHNKLSPRLNRLSESDQVLIANSIEMLVYLLEE
jgi:DNA-binding MarR family transcriptional regulator